VSRWLKGSLDGGRGTQVKFSRWLKKYKACKASTLDERDVELVRLDGEGGLKLSLVDG